MEADSAFTIKNFQGKPIPADRELRVFLPIEKVDAAQRMVYGWASVATQNGKALKDLQGEIVPLDAIKAALPGWMEWGGPIRAMHQPIAAGTTKHAEIIEGQDKEKEGLYIGAFIGDDREWQKVVDEIYRGFSIGGEKLEKIGDTITRLNLYEVSLVDRPANPAARIDVFKAAGLNVTSAVGLSKGWQPGVEDGVQFDRQEMGFMARIVSKLAGGGKTAKAEAPDPTDWARDGFSRPAKPVSAGQIVDEGNPANVGTLGPSEPLPHILTQPGGAPVPSSQAYLNDIPIEDRNRILLMAGKLHVFGKKGQHLGSYANDDKGRDEAHKRLKEHLDEVAAQKMLAKAEKTARKKAKLERAPVEMAKAFRVEGKFLAKRRIERAHRKFLKTMLAIVQPGSKGAPKLTRKRLVAALERMQAGRMRRLYRKADLEAMEKSLLATLTTLGLRKKEESTADVNDLPDSDFAYIEPGGKKDEDGKTVPRSLRHLPIHDAAHVRNAAARLNQTEIPAAAKKKAHRKIKARGKEFGVDVADLPKSEKGLRLSKDIADSVAQLRQIQSDIVNEGADEGGDPRDFQQAENIGEVIDDLSGGLDGLFPDSSNDSDVFGPMN